MDSEMLNLSIEQQRKYTPFLSMSPKLSSSTPKLSVTTLRAPSSPLESLSIAENT